MKPSAKTKAQHLLTMHYHQSLTGTPTQEMENHKMNDLMIKMYVAAKMLIEREEGQDLVEYALVVALIAFGAITGMKFLATGLNNAFSDIANVLTSNIT
jgi:pilus assembly protein Flp/PilA